MSWRDVASPIIAKVLASNSHRTEKEIREALYEAYPFGERRYFPYKVWLDEIQRQRGIKGDQKHEAAANEGQTSLFDPRN